MFCSNCGEKLPEDADLCPGCGDPVAEPERGPAERREATEDADAQPSATAVPRPTEEPAPRAPAAADGATSNPPPSEPDADANGEPTADQQPPPPPSTQVTGEDQEPPAPKKRTGSGKYCLFGCLGLLVLIGIVIAIGVMVSPGEDDEARTPPTTGQVQTDATPGADGEQAPVNDLATDVSDEGATEEVKSPGAATMEVTDFDPSTVDEDLVPVFYGFLKALAEEDPYEMEKWFSSTLQEKWDPDKYPASTDLKHVGYVMLNHSSKDDFELFVIREVLQEKSTGRTGKTDWVIKFWRIDGEWRVVDIPRVYEGDEASNQ